MEESPTSSAPSRDTTSDIIEEEVDLQKDRRDITKKSAAPPELEDELAHFRREWLAETRQQQKQKQKQEQQEQHERSKGNSTALPKIKPTAKTDIGSTSSTRTATKTTLSSSNGFISAARYESKADDSQTAGSPSYTSSISIPEDIKNRFKLMNISDDVSTNNRRVDNRNEQAQLGRDNRSTLSSLTGNSSSEMETPIMIYDEGVRAEREGRLNDALQNYRKAFRLDSDVDKAYHRAVTALLVKSSPSSRAGDPSEVIQNTSLVGNPQPLLSDHRSDSHARSTEFRFQRTLQFTPDYQAEQEYRTIETVENSMGKLLPTNAESSSTALEDNTHPSSTNFLIHSLLKSFAENQYDGESRTTEEQDEKIEMGLETGDPPERMSTLSSATSSSENILSSLVFLPADPEKPMRMGWLPREVLLMILRLVLLTSVIHSPARNHALVDEANKSHPNDTSSLPGHLHHSATTTRSSNDSMKTSKKGKKQSTKRSLLDSTVAIELELGLEGRSNDWRTDVESLERFAKTCRAARMLTLDELLWRELCERIYVPPHQISREENALQIVKELHANDCRRCFIEHPRIRLDGVFIAVVTYLRRGESSHSWYSPTHMITFYRYLRFYHTGLVISLLTVEAPSTVVRQLNPTLRMKGMMLGRWRLREEHVECWGLEDPAVEERSRKYSFRMNCRLRSTARGRMNKLEMISLATENRFTLELEDVPIKPTKPFFFSKVASYAGDDTATSNTT